MPNDSNKVSISVMLQMPSEPSSQKTSRPNLEDQVRACIQRIDDGTGTEVDFLVLKRLKTALLKKDTKSPRIQNLLQMIEPTLRRFGYYF